MQRDGHTLRDHLAPRVTQRSGVIQAVPYDCRIGRAIECNGHLVSSAGKRVLYDFTRDWIDVDSRHGVDVEFSHSWATRECFDARPDEHSYTVGPQLWNRIHRSAADLA